MTEENAFDWYAATLSRYVIVLAPDIDKARDKARGVLGEDPRLVRNATAQEMAIHRWQSSDNMQDERTVWILGETMPDGFGHVVLGVFFHRHEAAERCKSGDHFIVAAILGELVDMEPGLRVYPWRQYQPKA